MRVLIIIKFLFFLFSCSTIDQSDFSRQIASNQSESTCIEAVHSIFHATSASREQAEKLYNEVKEVYGFVVLDIGGEGRYRPAINLNPQGYTTTTGEAGRNIPNWVRGRGDALPFNNQAISGVLVENAPLNDKTLTEIKRVIAPRGFVSLSHPSEYAKEAHAKAVVKLNPHQVETIEEGENTRTNLFFSVNRELNEFSTIKADLKFTPKE